MELRFEVEGFDEGFLLVNKYLVNIGAVYPKQKDNESTQAYNKRVEYGRGFRSAFAECFEVYVAASRVGRYGARAGSVPAPVAFEIENTLFPALEAAWTEASKHKKEDQNDFFWEVFHPVLEEFMFPAALEEQDESFRRQAILNGTEEPEPDDKEWLNEEADALERRAADIRKRFDIG